MFWYPAYIPAPLYGIHQPTGTFMPERRRFVLIGRHISHSRSPEIMARLFRERDLDWTYDLMSIEPEELRDRILALKETNDVRGANVTAPYKEEVIPLMDELLPAASRVGAVNTILFREGRAIGTNTDAQGFAAGLRGCQLLINPFTAAVVGTGGAARAAIEVLLGSRNLTDLHILSRTDERAAEFAAEWGDRRLTAGATTYPFTAHLIVNATPVGSPHVPGSPLTAEQLSGCLLLYDMIYEPEQTELMANAVEQGIEVIGGMTMLVGQAEGAVEMWERDVPSRF